MNEARATDRRRGMAMAAAALLCAGSAGAWWMSAGGSPRGAWGENRREAERRFFRGIPTEDRPETANDYCPLMGFALDGEATVVEFEGTRIGLCCETCVVEWERMSPAQRGETVREWQGLEAALAVKEKPSRDDGAHEPLTE